MRARDDASIIFYGLNPTIPLEFESTDVDRYLVESLESNGLRKGCRLISYFRNGIFPEIKPLTVSHPFYLYEYPFSKPTSIDDWLRSVSARAPKEEYVTMVALDDDDPFFMPNLLNELAGWMPLPDDRPESIKVYKKFPYY